MNNAVFQEINNAMSEVLSSIDKVIDGLLSESGVYGEQANEFVQNCVSVFPQIILSYSEESLLKYADDVKYWPGLLNKIIEALRDVDRYKIIDVLYFETKQSLLEYQNLLRELELI